MSGEAMNDEGDRRLLTYDHVYGKPEYYWGREPNDLCLEAVRHFAAGPKATRTAIDLGCGEGRDLIYLARQGFAATGVDLSRPGLEKAQRWAREEGIAIQTIQASLLDYRLDQLYDLVYSSGTLTYLPPHLRAEVLQNYKAHTRPGGLNAFNVFVEKPYIATPPDWGADEYFYRSGELLSHYWDWEVLTFTEVTFDCNSSGVAHRHAMNVLVARRVV